MLHTACRLLSPHMALPSMAHGTTLTLAHRITGCNTTLGGDCYRRSDGSLRQRCVGRLQRARSLPGGSPDWVRSLILSYIRAGSRQAAGGVTGVALAGLDSWSEARWEGELVCSAGAVEATVA